MEESVGILVVDDEEANRAVLGAFLGEMGHECQFAENGLSALAEMTARVPDLILLDLMMPVMDGFQVLEHLASDPQLGKTPVIVISALDDMESIVRCVEAGADDYLTKPFNRTLLRARVKSSLAKKRARDLEEAYRRQVERYNTELETKVREQVQEISTAQLASIFAMTTLSGSRDPETGEHLRRIQEFCRLLSGPLAKTACWQHESTGNWPNCRQPRLSGSALSQTTALRRRCPSFDFPF